MLSKKTSPFPSTLNCITLLRTTGEKADNGISTLFHPLLLVPNPVGTESV